MEQRPQTNDGEKINHTFTTKNPVILGKIMQLGHAFTQAVAAGDEALARRIIRQALIVKEMAIRQNT